MKIILNKLVIVSIIMSFWSCATIMTGTKQDISVNSDPVGAKIIITTSGGVPVNSGRTPATFSLKKGKEYRVKIEMDGYRDQEMFISKDFNMYVAGNLICGGPLGLVIDFVSGALWNLDPEEIYVSLDTAELANGQKELYALFNYYDESQGSVVSLPIKLDKIN